MNRLWNRNALPVGRPALRAAIARGAIAAALVVAVGPAIEAFCGFYVARADTKLFNRASKVVLVRDGDRTVITMANDFKGDPTDFAVVIPVPTFVRRDQIRVVEPAIIDHLDAYTAPRLVEYFDEDPCRRHEVYAMAPATVSDMARTAMAADARARSLGVTVEARYTVGEYDILILSATESAGLETWLRENRYRIPEGASAVLASYIRQNMRFFVARTNLAEQSRLGFSYLRPIQVAYESPKFMLPIRLGTVNADGPQELFVLALTRRGRIETTNYRTVRLPTGVEIPPFVKAEFGKFYRAMFDEQVRRERMKAVFLEYAWDMGWCDPCAADPLSTDELRALGVFWVGEGGGRERRPIVMGAPDVFVTRLHVRYDGARFPEDLVFQETPDRTSFQGRFVIRHAWQGDSQCPAAREYRRELTLRREREAQALASLTGWNIGDIRRRLQLPADDAQRPWWVWWR